MSGVRSFSVCVRRRDGRRYRLPANFSRLRILRYVRNMTCLLRQPAADTTIAISIIIVGRRLDGVEGSRQGSWRLARFSPIRIDAYVGALPFDGVRPHGSGAGFAWPVVLENVDEGLDSRLRHRYVRLAQASESYLPRQYERRMMECLRSRSAPFSRGCLLGR